AECRQRERRAEVRGVHHLAGDPGAGHRGAERLVSRHRRYSRAAARVGQSARPSLPGRVARHARAERSPVPAEPVLQESDDRVRGKLRSRGAPRFASLAVAAPPLAIVVWLFFIPFLSSAHLSFLRDGQWTLRNYALVWRLYKGDIL